MSETSHDPVEAHESGPDEVREPGPGEVRAQPAETGHAGVDAVVASLDALDDAPVADHVAVFEQAHDSLRRALSDAGDTPRR